MLCAALVLALAPTQDVHVDELHGFQVEVPEGWRTLEQEAQGNFVLSLLPPGSGGEVALSITVRELPGGEGIEEVLAAGRASMNARSQSFSEVEDWSEKLPVGQARGFRVVYHAAGQEFRIIANYLVDSGSAYVLQRIAPRADFQQREEDFAPILASFGLVEITEQGREQRSRADMIARCGSEVDWAPDWETAATRAEASGKAVLVVAFVYGGFAMTETPRTGLFMNEDIIGLVNERFVPLWYTKGMQGDFVDGYGFSPMTFGQALMVVAPDGEVLLESQAASDADVAHAFLRTALARHPQFTGSPLPADLSDIERARAQLARGDHAACRSALGEDTSGPAELVRARLARLEHRGEDGLAAVARAREAGGAHLGELLVEEAELLMRIGRLADSRSTLEQLIEGEGGQEFVLEAQLGLSMLDLAEGRGEAAKARWEALVREHPESRWAWLAAVGLESPLLGSDLRPTFEWPSQERLDEFLAFPNPAPRSQENERVARAEAVAWLLAHQRPDGSWLCPMESSDPQLGPSPFTDSVTAFALRALLRNPAAEACTEAAQRALSFLVANVAKREEVPPRVFFMDYMTWSDSVMLHALVDALEAGIVTREEIAPTVEALVADLAGRQVEGDGWSYYVTGDLQGEAAPTQSISFTTATGVLGLSRVRGAGFDVADKMYRAAVSALERMRNERGGFDYFLYEGSVPDPARGHTPGDVGRGPACELALFSAGTSSPERLRNAIDLFLEHAPLYSAEVGKVMMHSGPHGQGCHYPLYDYTHAALAQEALPQNKEAQARIQELVLDCRQADGSFLDTPILGRAYGTSMALIALDALDPRAR